MNYKRIISVFIGLALFSGSILWPACKVEELANDTPISASLEFADTSITAGEELGIIVRTAGFDDMSTLYMIVASTWGEALKTATVNNNHATYVLSSDETRKVGRITLSLIANQNVLDRKHLTILPGDPVTPIEMTVGPKSIFTSAAQPSMLISMPHDSLNNPVPNGTECIFNLMRPSGAKNTTNNTVQNLFAHQTFTAQTLEGKTFVGVQSGSQTAREQEIIEKSGWPSAIKILVKQSTPYADSRQYTHLETQQMKDALGNEIANGTQICFRLENKRDNLVQEYYSLSVASRAEVYIRNPKIPSTWEVIAFVPQGVGSKPVILEYISAIKELPVKFFSNDKNVQIGPVQGYLGQHLPDGTELVAYLIDGQNQTVLEFKEFLQNGMLQIPLQTYDLVKGRYTIKVECAGKVAQTEINLLK